MRKKGVWKILDSEEKYKNDFLQLREDKVIKPDGEEGVYATIKLRDGIQVLAVDDKGIAHFVKEFRYAIERYDIESVGGTMNEGESAEQAAGRELKEELGIEAEIFTQLGNLHHSTSIISSNTILFLALNLRFGEKNQDENEQIKEIEIPLSKAVQMVYEGEFTHASTCILILRANHYLTKERLDFGKINEKEKLWNI